MHPTPAPNHSSACLSLILQSYPSTFRPLSPSSLPCLPLHFSPQLDKARLALLLVERERDVALVQRGREVALERGRREELEMAVAVLRGVRGKEEGGVRSHREARKSEVSGRSILLHL